MKQGLPSYLGFWLSLALVYKKDSLSQWRRPTGLLTSLLFSTILATVYSYALKTEVFFKLQNFEGIVLASLFFSVTLACSQSFRTEHEAGALHIMNMSPLDPVGAYVAKVIAYWQSQFVFISLCLPIYFLFLQGKLPASVSLWLPLFISLILCALSLSTLATLLSYISLEKGLQAVFMPLLLLPLSLPVLILALSFLTEVHKATNLTNIDLWNYLMLIAPAGLYGGVGALLYFKLAVDAA